MQNIKILPKVTSKYQLCSEVDSASLSKFMVPRGLPAVVATTRLPQYAPGRHSPRRALSPQAIGYHNLVQLVDHVGVSQHRPADVPRQTVPLRAVIHADIINGHPLKWVDGQNDGATNHDEQCFCMGHCDQTKGENCVMDKSDMEVDGLPLKHLGFESRVNLATL